VVRPAIAKKRWVEIRRAVMLPNTYFLEKYAEIRHEEMVEEVRLERLIEGAKGQKPKLWQKLIEWVDDWMTGLGHRLKRTQTLRSKLGFFRQKV
jgi:hypothetical protein